MQHCQKSRLNLSSHIFPYLLEIVILFDCFIWQGFISISEVPISSRRRPRGVARDVVSNSLVD